jgi:hypothetical protein
MGASAVDRRKFVWLQIRHCSSSEGLVFVVVNIDASGSGFSRVEIKTENGTKGKVNLKHFDVDEKK